MVSHSFSDLFLGLLRASLIGLGDTGGEVNAVFSVDSLSLFGELFSAKDVVDLLVGFGERRVFRLLSSDDYCSEWVGYFGRTGGGH